MPGVHDYAKFIKRGFGRGTDFASQDVRAGIMTRQEGFEIAKEDSKRPPGLDYYLEITGYTEEEFIEILKSMRQGKALNCPSGGDSLMTIVNTDIAKLTATEFLFGFAEGTISCYEYSSALTQNILEQNTKLNAFAFFDPELFLANANECDKLQIDHLKNGYSGLAKPLLGLPIGVKAYLIHRTCRPKEEAQSIAVTYQETMPV